MHSVAKQSATHPSQTMTTPSALGGSLPHQYQTSNTKRLLGQSKEVRQTCRKCYVPLEQVLSLFADLQNVHTSFASGMRCRSLRRPPILRLQSKTWGRKVLVFEKSDLFFAARFEMNASSATHAPPLIASAVFAVSTTALNSSKFLANSRSAFAIDTRFIKSAR